MPTGLSDSWERCRQRYSARAMLWKASTLKSVRLCGRVIQQDESESNGIGCPGVPVKHGGARTSVGYGNLMTCG